MKAYKTNVHNLDNTPQQVSFVIFVPLPSYNPALQIITEPLGAHRNNSSGYSTHFLHIPPFYDFLESLG
jgi:hypothetical protein